MSDWTYCMHCRAGLDAPSLSEVMRGLRVCPNPACCTPLQVRNELEDIAEAAERLEERLDEIERRLAL